MKSKLELRQFAVTTAANAEGVTAENFIAFAKSVEEYVLGGVELPEHYDEADQMQRLTEMIANSTVTPKPINPIPYEKTLEATEEEAEAQVVNE